jgi:hypothetical protein
MAANTADGALLLVKKLGGVVLILVGIIAIAVDLEYRTIGFSAGITAAGIVALACGMALLALKIIRRKPECRHGELAHDLREPAPGSN